MALPSSGIDLDRVAQEEIDPGLGNGGLGRLAACFLDSLATLQFPAVGYGIRYDYGIFTQVIDEDGRQREIASSWLRQHNPWEIPRDDASYVVRYGGRCVATQDAQGKLRYRWVDTHNIWAVGFDQLIPGNRSPTVNHLRLWSGRAIAPFDVEAVQRGPSCRGRRPRRSTPRTSRASCTRTTRRRRARNCGFKQQYFFVSASLQDILAQHLDEGRTLRFAARRDRDPAERHASGARDPRADAPAARRARSSNGSRRGPSRGAFSRTRTTRCCPRRSRPGRSRFFERLLPRHLQIIYLINRALLDEVSARYPHDTRAAPPHVADRRVARPPWCAWRTSPSSAATRSTASPSCIRSS